MNMRNLCASQNHKGGHLSNKYEAPATLKQFTSDNEYAGSAIGSYAKSSESYDDMMNAVTNPNKEIIAQGRAQPEHKKELKRQQVKANKEVAEVSKQNATIDCGNKANVSVTTT